MISYGISYVNQGGIVETVKCQYMADLLETIRILFGEGAIQLTVGKIETNSKEELS